MAELDRDGQFDRNAKNAAALMGRDARLARDDRGAQKANADHVERRQEMAARPTQINRIERPMFKGLKQVDTTVDHFKSPKKR